MDTDSQMVKYALVEHKPIWLNSDNKAQTVEIIRYYFTKEEAFSGLEAFFDGLRRRHDRTALAASTYEIVGMDEAAPVSELYRWDETIQSGVKLSEKNPRTKSMWELLTPEQSDRLANFRSIKADIVPLAKSYRAFKGVPADEALADVLDVLDCNGQWILAMLSKEDYEAFMAELEK